MKNNPFGSSVARLLPKVWLRDSPRLVLIAFFAPAILSLSLGIFRALHGSIDLQWSAARLVSMHRDPWRLFLTGDPHHEIILAQHPNYLPELYILFLPLGLTSFSTALRVWVCVNLALSITGLWLTVKTFDLEAVPALICAAVFLASTPLRAALGNGQQISLVLVFLTATFYCTAPPWKGLWLGLSYCKYSFAPVICLTWLFERRYLVLSYSLVAPIVGLLGVYHLVHSPLSDLILGPVRTNGMTVLKNPIGVGNIMSIIKLLVDRSHTNRVIWFHLPEFAALLGSFGAAIYLHRLKSIGEPARAALLMTLALLLFWHLIYDYVVLLLPFAAALASKKPAAKAGALVIIFYFWFGAPFIENRLVQGLSIPLLCTNCLGLSVLAWLITVL